MSRKGFTLIELLLVIMILGILVGSLLPNFLNSLKKGRDSRRKQDLEQIQKAVESYYEDKKVFPSTIDFGNALIDSVSTKVYMKIVPNDPISGQKYRYCWNTSYSQYKLLAKLENSDDPKIISPNISGFTCTTGDCHTLGCNYGISSSDTTPGT